MTKKEIAHEKEFLLKLVKPGDTIYTVLRHVSKSGMYRVIDCYVIRDNEPLRISWSVAAVCSDRYDTRHEGIGIGGCGMDMGFAIVYNLSRVLFKEGFQCIGEHCPSNDHANPPHPERDGKMMHSDPGYALKQRWM